MAIPYNIDYSSLNKFLLEAACNCSALKEVNKRLKKISDSLIARLFWEAIKENTGEALGASIAAPCGGYIVSRICAEGMKKLGYFTGISVALAGTSQFFVVCLDNKQKENSLKDTFKTAALVSLVGGALILTAPTTLASMFESIGEEGGRVLGAVGGGILGGYLPIYLMGSQEPLWSEQVLRTYTIKTLQSLACTSVVELYNPSAGIMGWAVNQLMGSLAYNAVDITRLVQNFYQQELLNDILPAQPITQPMNQLIARLASHPSPVNELTATWQAEGVAKLQALITAKRADVQGDNQIIECILKQFSVLAMGLVKDALATPQFLNRMRACSALLFDGIKALNSSTSDQIICEALNKHVRLLKAYPAIDGSHQRLIDLIYQYRTDKNIRKSQVLIEIKKEKEKLMKLMSEQSLSWIKIECHPTQQDSSLQAFLKQALPIVQNHLLPLINPKDQLVIQLSRLMNKVCPGMEENERQEVIKFLIDCAQKMATTAEKPVNKKFLGDLTNELIRDFAQNFISEKISHLMHSYTSQIQENVIDGMIDQLITQLQAMEAKLMMVNLTSQEDKLLLRTLLDVHLPFIIRSFGSTYVSHLLAIDSPFNAKEFYLNVNRCIWGYYRSSLGPRMSQFMEQQLTNQITHAKLA